MIFSGCAHKPVAICPQLQSPSPPVLYSAHLNNKSTPVEIEKAHVTDILALKNYSENLKNIIEATQK